MATPPNEDWALRYYQLFLSSGPHYGRRRQERRNKEKKEETREKERKRKGIRRKKRQEKKWIGFNVLLLELETRNCIYIFTYICT